MKPKRPAVIRAIIFDLGNVLIFYDIRKAARRFAKRCGVSLVRLWLHFLTSRVEEDYACGRISSREFYRRIRRSLGLSVDYPVFKSCWNEIFWANRGMEGLLIALKKAYPLYLLTNTNALHFEYLKKRYPGIFRHFRKVYASHQIKCRKPEARAYRKILREKRLRPEAAVFIDDNPKFVSAARRLGLCAVRFRDRKRLRRDLGRLGIWPVKTRTGPGRK